MSATGAVDFHPGKIWTDTDGDLVQVSKLTSWSHHYPFQVQNWLLAVLVC